MERSGMPALPDREALATAQIVAYVRWAAIGLGVIQAFLTDNPAPVGGPWLVLAATLAMAAYNLPATAIRRLPQRWAGPLILGALFGDFIVCSAWTMLNANDIYSTTYAIYTLVAIEAATLYQWRGTFGFITAFIVAYVGLYLERFLIFGFGVEPASVLYRFAMVALAAVFVGAIAKQSRQRQRHALRDAVRYQSMLEAISQLGEGVVVVREGRIISANSAYCQLTGYSEEELKSLSGYIEVIAPEARAALIEVSGLNTSGHGESLLLRKDGERVPIEWASHTATIDGSERILGVVRDATERRNALQLIEQARDAAEAASQAKSEHLSRMSHELRTPLTAIIGYTDLLEMELQGSKRDKLEAILKAATHLLDLVNDVLEISRVSDADARNLQSTDVEAAATEAIELLKPRAQARGILIHHEFAGDKPLFVAANSKWLRQVLLNLLSNAVNYNRDYGKVLISVSETSTNRIRVSVTDTGPGIKESLLDRLWEPFERLGAERTTVEGAGLGLALTKKLVEAMGGEIGVQTQSGSGSTFWFELAPATRSVSATTDDADSQAASSPRLLPQKTVLYVEDNLATVDVMEAIFAERRNVRLITVMQGHLAIEMARQHHPHLILLDVHLPDMTGDQVLAALKAQPETAAIPVVVISADATPKQIQRLCDIGADQYLTKPIRVQEFLRIIDEKLGLEPALEN